MSTSSSYFANLTEAVGDAWNRFWFTPASPLPCAVLRIIVGLLALAHLGSLAIDHDRWYAPDGLLSQSSVNTLLTVGSQQETTHRFSYLSYLTSATELRVVYFVALAAAAAFTLGLFTRVTGVLTLLAVLAYVHRVPQVAGHLEPVLAYLLPYLVIAPSGSLLSLDSVLFRARTNKPAAPPASDPAQPSIPANIGLRLIQVHTAMFYAMMGLTKLYGDAWWQGDAIWILLAQTESRPLDLTGIRGWGKFGEYVINFWSLAIVYLELSFPILAWNRLARPLLVLLAAIVWCSIALVTGHVLFALAMITASTAFLPAEFFARLAPTKPRPATAALSS